MIDLRTRLDTLAFADAKTQKALAGAGLETVEQLLAHYPFRYEDRRAFGSWPHDALPEAVCLHGEVTDAALKRLGYRKAFVEITIEPLERGGMDEPIILRWFNMPFIFKSFAAGMEIIAYGKVKRTKTGKLIMDHPEHEIITADADDFRIHLNRIVPVYHAREGVPQKTLRRMVHLVLEQLAGDAVQDILPAPSGDGAFAGMSRQRAVAGIHFPASMEEMENARRYLALEEFFALQLNVLKRRKAWESLSGLNHCGAGLLMESWRALLPFSLTGAQERSIAEIRTDLEAPRAMHRMLQGDVGSGKTFVAMAAMLLAVESGCQAALMAPTQILAEQHFVSFQRWLEPLHLRISLRTSNRREDAWLPILTDGASEPQIVIGTHALLYEASGGFTDLGLIVIDEQHKFGVEQRSRLIRQGVAPDVLVMTATPIPRTLTMTVYGDLDVSILDELPAGRRPILTAVREEPDPVQVAAFLNEQFDAGRQAYLVFPLVEESGKLDVRAATAEFEGWKQRLPGRELGLVHGRMAAEQKEQVMRDFREGRLHGLVATTVIEVGVDVPNATVMIVFDAERFGLAQLHQLRGRVGRGEHKSYCILIASGENPEAVDRLRNLEKTTDGFAVAEADLKFRGPGDLLGTAQSGLPGLRLGDLVQDARLVRTARRLANEILDADPDLTLPGNAKYRPLLLSSALMSTLG